MPLALAELGIPPGFPHQHERKYAGADHAGLDDAGKSGNRIGRLDLPGGVLFLAACILLLVALQGADISWDWSSTVSICLLVFAGASFALFVFWERQITLSDSPRVPLLTWEFCNLKTVSLLR